MKQNIIILSANPYSLTDERTGEVRSGISCQYLLTDTLFPFHDSTSNFRGYKVLKSSLSNSESKQLSAVPGIYEADMSVSVKASGKAELKPVTVTFKSSFKS